VSGAEQIRSVQTELSFVAQGSFINRRFVAPGREVNTGTYERYRVEVCDARDIRDRFTLDNNGFVLADHKSSVADFLDSAQVDAIYPGEVEAIVKRLTGADLVVPRGWMIRSSGDIANRQRKVVGYTHSGGVQPPASEAHVDFTPERAELMGQHIYRDAFPDAEPYTRFIASSLWRAFSPPPQDWPLALCDGRTVAIDEGVPNALFVVDEIPDRDVMLGHMPDEDNAITASIFHHNPAHRWWYFSNMNRDEVVLLKFHDSDTGKACRVPHTAFRDPSFADAQPRESIEFRTFAYFL
jgi:hypothetical protein